MSNEQFPKDFPEVLPQPFTPETKHTPSSIEVINGALEQLEREEREGGKEDDTRPPTFH